MQKSLCFIADMLPPCIEDISYLIHHCRWWRIPPG